MRKTGLQKSNMFSTNTVFKIMYFFLQETEETKSEILPDHRHHQYKYTFWGQDHVVNFKRSTTMLLQGESHTQNNHCRWQSEF
jgi:hypothetical protein